MVESKLIHMAPLNNEVKESFLEKFKDFEVKIRSGSSVIKVQPLFYYNSRCLIVASGPNIKVYDIQSSECFHTLRYHKTNVISLQENKNNCVQFFSCSQDGVVVRWEIATGTFLKVYKLHMPVVNFYAPTKSYTWFVTKKLENSEEYRLYSLQPSKRKATDVHSILHPVLPNHNAISFGLEGSYVAAVCDNTLSIFQFETKQFVRHLSGTYKLKCVICHPTDFTVATGDDQGRVLVWSNLFETKSPIHSIYHWHTLPVSDLAFSTEGSFLYSGGGEASLVKWNLNSQEKSVLSRIGAPIVWIKVSPDSSCVATSLEDNSLKIIDPQKNVLGQIQGLTRAHFQGDPKRDILTTGLLYDPQTKSLVLNGKPGHLQFYNVFEDKHLFNLDISSRNFITRERDHLNNNIDVCKAAIDEKGQWLATVEYWCNGEVSPMIWLKFWEYNMVEQMFVMNTNIYLPHNKEVNCILFRPYDTADASPVVVTTSMDCRFKTWFLCDDDNSFEGKQSWNCASMDYYREHLPTGDASFSEDGSVLAVAVSNVATLWTDNNTQLRAALFQEKNEEPIKQLRFGKHSCSHLLVCHDGCKIDVWNTLSLSITVTIHVSVQTIAADITSDLMAVFSKDDDENYQNLHLFKPNSPHPLFFKKNVSDKPVLSAIFVPKSSKSLTTDKLCYLEKSTLFFFNEDQCLFTLTDECDDSADYNLNKIKTSTWPITPFGFLQAEQKASDVKQVTQQPLVIEYTGKDSLEYANPTYIDHFAICSQVLRSLLRPKPSQEPVADPDSESKKRKKGSSEKGKVIARREEKEESENLENQFGLIKLDDWMNPENAEKKKEDFTIRVTDFSFLLKHVNLPMT